MTSGCHNTLPFTFFQTSCYFYLFHYPIDFRIVASKLWHSQNYTLLLTTNHIKLCSLLIPLIIYIFTFIVCSISLSFLKKLYTLLTYISLSIFFNLKHCFLANSELITNSITHYPTMPPLSPLSTYQFSLT